MSLMWSWHWSPLTQSSLLLSPSDGLASFLKTTLANGVKVVKKVITSKFRFHLIAIYALGCFRNFGCTPVPTKITWLLVKVNLQPGLFILDVIPTVRILYLCQSDFPCSVQIHYFRQFRRVMSQSIVRKVIHGTVTRQNQVKHASSWSWG
jgi:hypothetical protein